MTVLSHVTTVLMDTEDHGVAAISDARHALAAWLADRAVPQETIDTLVLVASELATNAVRYTFGRVRVEVGETDGDIVVQVFDESLELPNALLAKPDDPGGHGLAIVDALADRWGAEHATLHGKTGKIVWAAVRGTV